MLKLKKILPYAMVISLLPLKCAAASPNIPYNFPTNVEPGRLLRDLETPPELPKPDFNPFTDQYRPKKLPLGDEYRLNLKSVVFEGNTIFSNEELQKVIAEKEKVLARITLADLKEIPDAITLKYRNAGYVLARAILPEQKIKNGVVHIKIFEGRVANTTVEGNLKQVQSLLQAYVVEVQKSDPLNISVLERYILLANDLPGVKVRSLLSPSKTEQGASDLSFIGEQRQLEGMVAVDNRGLRFMGPVQILARGNMNSFYTDGDSLGVKALFTKDPSQLKFIQLSDQHPIGEKGLTGLLGGSYVHAHPGSTLRPLNIVASANVISYEISYPYLRAREKSLFLSASFDVLDSKTDILGARFFNDHIRSLRCNLTYMFQDKWSGSNSMRVSIAQGLPILASNSRHATNVSRPGGKSVYTKAQLSFNRNHDFKNQFSLSTDMKIQCGFTRLLSPEQFSYGGQQFGVAYDSSELTGNSGVAGKLELRYTANFVGKSGISRSVEPYVLVDGGVVWSPVQVSSKNTASATSTGLGFRIRFSDKTFFQSEVTQPLSRPAALKVLHTKGPRIFLYFHQIL